MRLGAGRAPRVLFLDLSTGLGTLEGYNGAVGGRVGSLRIVSDYLAREGWRVEVLSDCAPGETTAGARWVDRPEGRYDVLVLNRGLGRGYAEIDARHRVLWTHDLPHTGYVQDARHPRMLSGVVYMSRYGRDVWRTAFPSLGRGVIIPNGVDRKLFRPIEKDLDLIVYASAPNRGLSRLPLILDAVRTRSRPDVYLVAYSNLAKLHPVEVGETDENACIYAEIVASDVDLRDPIPQPLLAGQLARAGMMILPTGYPEICSNIVLQALSCGVPIVTTGHLGATPEWVSARNGSLTRYQPHDYMVYTMEIVRNASAILNDVRRHRSLIDGASRTPVWSWDKVGHAWHKYLSRFS